MPTRGDAHQIHIVASLIRYLPLGCSRIADWGGQSDPTTRARKSPFGAPRATGLSRKPIKVSQNRGFLSRKRMLPTNLAMTPKLVEWGTVPTRGDGHQIHIVASLIRHLPLGSSRIADLGGQSVPTTKARKSPFRAPRVTGLSRKHIKVPRIGVSYLEKACYLHIWP